MVYNTHLKTWNENTLRPEKQDGYTACHHHHQGQKNRLHQKTITHPHATPPQMPGIDTEFLGGGESIVWPPLIRGHGMEIYTIQFLLLQSGEMYQSAKKRNKQI